MTDISKDLYDLKQLASEVLIDEKFSYDSEFEVLKPVLELVCSLLKFESLRKLLPARYS
jgi:hypothetical protein